MRGIAMKPGIPSVLYLPLCIGTLFTGIFVCAWVAYFWGDGNEERVVVLSGIELFAGPLLAGAIQAIRGRRSGFVLLKVGSVVLVCQPDIILTLWLLEYDSAYLRYLFERSMWNEAETVKRRRASFPCGEHRPRPTATTATADWSAMESHQPREAWACARGVAVQATRRES